MSCESNPYPGGKNAYKIYCENCHMEDGSGLPPMYPSLINSSYLNINLDKLPCLIKNGKQSAIVQNIQMPSHNLSDVTMTNLISYMRENWGDKKTISLSHMKTLLANCEKVD